MDLDFYPPLEAGSVTAVRAALSQMRRHPDWLDRKECPYDVPTRLGLAELLRALPASSVDPPSAEDVEEDADRYTALERDATTMLRDLRTLTRDFAAGDTKERLTSFKVAAGLMEKLIDIGERANNLRDISHFQRAVVRVFDQVLTPPQRTQALRLLEIEAETPNE